MSQVSRSTLLVRAIGWAAVVGMGFVFVAWPLMQGRWYGVGQALFYCFLIALAAWVLHWTQREMRREGDRILVTSPIHRRNLPIEGLRAEVRKGWWTRIVLLPRGRLPVSFLRPLWRPDPEALLRSWLPAEAVSMEITPGVGDPGPEEGEDRLTE